jgi:hypothetical protein
VLLRGLWLLGVVTTCAALVVLEHAHVVTVDARVTQSVAAAFGALLALGLAARSGSRAWPAGVLAAAFGSAAVLTQSSTLLGGAAVATGVLAACLAVLGTAPAPTPWRVVAEVVLAQLLATIGAVGVAGFRTDLDPARFRYTVLGLAMVGTVALVHRLGGGVHGLGRNGAMLVVAALLLLVVGLAYTAALTRWGSPELRLDVADVRHWVRDHLGAVPHPVEVLLGVPALAWGASMRSRRRQGWWVCAFGATATATATTRLVVDDATLTGAALGTAYGVVLGLLVGFVAIRAVRLLRGRPGRRAARADEVAHRREPPRLHPLH